MGLQVPIVVLQYARDPEHLGVLVRVLWILQQGLPWSSWAELGRLSGVDRHRARRACRFLQNLPSADWSDHTSQNSPVNRSEQQDTDEIGLIQYPVNSSEQLEPKSSHARARDKQILLLSMGSTTEHVDSEESERIEMNAGQRPCWAVTLPNSAAAEPGQSKPALIEPPLIPPLGVSVPPLTAVPIVARVPSERGPSLADELGVTLRLQQTQGQICCRRQNGLEGGS